MNAAFAIGRLLDMNPGKERLLNLPDTEKMVSRVETGHFDAKFSKTPINFGKVKFGNKAIQLAFSVMGLNFVLTWILFQYMLVQYFS